LTGAWFFNIKEVFGWFIETDAPDVVAKALGLSSVGDGISVLPPPEERIPKGPYCYTLVGVERQEGEEFPRLKTKVCPFLRHSNHGIIYCEYLSEPGKPYGSLDNNEEASTLALKRFETVEEVDEICQSILLWDSVKECGINTADEEDQEEL
jgi:hypothetical protein